MLCQVPVTVTDINDNAPVFDPVSYTAVVSESSLTGVEVVTLTASDRDSSNNAQLVYNITKGNTDSDFTIDPVKGKITVAKGLDIERTIRYDLEVVVKDIGIPSLNATVCVHSITRVLGENDFIYVWCLLGNCCY